MLARVAYSLILLTACLPEHCFRTGGEMPGILPGLIGIVAPGVAGEPAPSETPNSMQGKPRWVETVGPPCVPRGAHRRVIGHEPDFRPSSLRASTRQAIVVPKGRDAVRGQPFDP